MSKKNVKVVKKGRPVNPNSKRQQRLAELEAKKANNGGVMPLGRPKSKVEEIEIVKNESGELEIVAS